MTKYVPSEQLKNYILQKDLPGLPRGRKFMPCKVANKNGKPEYYFSSMRDEERLGGKLQDYKLQSEFVEENPEWFKKEI